MASSDSHDGLLETLLGAQNYLDAFIEQSKEAKQCYVFEAEKGRIVSQVAMALISSINRILQSLRAGNMADLEELKAEHVRLIWLYKTLRLYYDTFHSSIEDMDKALSRATCAQVEQLLSAKLPPVPKEGPRAWPCPECATFFATLCHYAEEQEQLIVDFADYFEQTEIARAAAIKK